MTFSFKYQEIKAIADVVCAVLLVIILMPLVLVISVLIKLLCRGEIFYKQKRTGKDGEIFEILKFRTMTGDCDDGGNLLPDIKRITYIGSILRLSSIDELPNLINIIRGDMSFIGPRPLLPQYFNMLTKRQKGRYLVKPGLTGLAQIRGRNCLTWERRLAYDLVYQKKMSFYQDVCILLQTVYTVLYCRNVNSSSSETMSEFTGTKYLRKRNKQLT